MEKEKKYWEVLPGDPTRMGAHKSEKGYWFSVAVPDGAEASLLFYRKGSQKVEIEIVLPEETRCGDVNAVLVQHFPRGEWEYNYRIDDKIVQDPYAKQIIGRERFGQGVEWNQPHSVRCGFGKTPAMVSRELEQEFEDMIFYKTHVRGFTMQRGSRVRRKGTFAGVMEKIPYLQELGINALELMPVYEFDELPPKQPDNLPDSLLEQVLQVKKKVQTVSEKKIENGEEKSHAEEKLNYWGYGNACYFAPKASYTAGNNPIAEFAQMVDALHQAGIACVLEFYFSKETVPGYVLDVLRYWKTTFHIDGFHLIGEGVPIDAVVKEPLFSDTKLLYAGYDGNALYPDGKVTGCKHLADYHTGFEETMRRFLKGDAGMLEAFAGYTRKNPVSCGTIQFLSNNNGFTLADAVSYNEKHNEDNGEQNHDGSRENFSWNCGIEGPTRKQAIKRLRLRQQKNAFLLLLLAQGTPLIYGGDEFGNSQNGNNNAYCQDNEIGWLNWSAQKTHTELTEFVKAAILFRKNHKILHMEKPLRQMDYLAIGVPDLSYHGKRAWFAPMDERSIGMLYCGTYAKGTGWQADGLLYIAYNMHWEEQELALPVLPEEGSWYLAADTSERQGFYPEGQERLLEEKKSIVVAPRSIYILIGKQGVEADADLEAF